jgi:hypothetical protein
MPEQLPKLPPPIHCVVPNSTATKVIGFYHPPTTGHAVIEVIAWHVEVCQTIKGNFYTEVEPVTVDEVGDIFCYRTTDESGKHSYVFRSEITLSTLQEAIAEAQEQWENRRGHKPAAVPPSA